MSVGEEGVLVCMMSSLFKKGQHRAGVEGCLDVDSLALTTYLVDVLQRVSEHPSKDVIELTPRVWESRFTDNPLRSDLTDSV